MDRIIIKQGRKIFAYIDKQKDNTYSYSFGSPSKSSCHIAFNVDSLELAKERVYEVMNDWKQFINK